ncbi:MAG: hypothetical protein JKY37_31255 [Nannocystaceae bacterium]|nr:hypothetical protein [Nannocystaceae bacterium]
MRWTAALLAAGTLAQGCADDVPAEHDEDAMDSSGGGDDRAEGGPPVEQIVIPMRPVESNELHGGVPAIVETAEGPRLTMDAFTTLALGDRYPSEFTATLSASRRATCGPIEGPVTLTRLTSVEDGPGSDAVTVALDGSAAISFTTHSPGRHVLVGEGTVTLTEDACGHPAGTTLPFDLGLTTVVIPANAARIKQPCSSGDSGSVEVAPSSHVSSLAFSRWFSPTLVDETGESVVVDNADPDAQVTVRMYGTFDAGHASPASLSEWITPSRVGVVDIVPDFGEPTVVDVVELSRVTAVSIEFQLAGFAAGPLTLENGAVYGEDGWARVGNRVAPMVQELRTDQGVLCSGPSPGWFSLDTMTPDVCKIVDLGSSLRSTGPYLLHGDQIGHAARLEKAGVCSLAVRAPGLSASIALPTLEATFRDPSGLHEG